jgi:hypothetical protein
MPLNLAHVYTDRMRVYRKVSGPRVMGERPMYETVSGWTACRIAPPTGRERREAGLKRDVEYSHQLICGFADEMGVPVQIREQDRIEVQAGPIPFTPSGMFEVIGVMIPRDLREHLLQVIQLQQRKEI